MKQLQDAVESLEETQLCFSVKRKAKCLTRKVTHLVFNCFGQVLRNKLKVLKK